MITRSDVPPSGVLETCVYAEDLHAADRFYGGVLGLERVVQVEGRHIFYRCGGSMLLVFNPARTLEPSGEGAEQAPTHGAVGPGHVAFAVRDDELPAWRARLQRAGIDIEAERDWPLGGRSLYVRDHAGNSVELASPMIWGFAEEDGSDAPLTSTGATSMVDLRDVQTGLVVARISETQLEFLVHQLEEESRYDRDYHLDAATLEHLAGAGAEPELIDTLRAALRGRDSIEVEWSRRG